MNIKFRTYGEMVEIEDLLLGRGYKAKSVVDTTYYNEFTDDGLMRAKGTTEFLVVVIDMETKIYKVTFAIGNNNPIYIYPEMKNLIFNALVIPTYKARKISKL